MNNNIKKADFTIVSEPTHVITECPYCDEDIEIEYEDMSMISVYPGDWRGEIIECSNCDGEIYIDYVDWD